MGKNKEKKPSPWANVPVTPYEKLHPTTLEKKKMEAMRKIVQHNRKMGHLIQSSNRTIKNNRSTSKVQYVPVQKEVIGEATIKDENGQPVKTPAKVVFKTKSMKKIVHKPK